MCIIIDINTLSSVFDSCCSDHDEFKPVNEWILNGNGKVIFGGTTYINELKKSPNYLRLIRRLKDARKACEICKDKIDISEQHIKSLEKHPDFDDPHILAILIESRIRIVCSKDKRSFPFLKKRELYPKRFKLPSIYSGKRNARMLNNGNIVSTCNEC